MKKFLKRFLIGIKCVWYLIGCYFCWILKYSKHPEKYPLEVRYARVRKLVRFILRRAHMDLHVENIPDFNVQGSLFLSCNHVSALDPLLLVALSEKPIRFISKIENRKLIFAGRILRCMDAFFLDRKDPRQAIQIFKEAYETMKRGDAHICIYPEGTRNRDPLHKDLHEFHPGSFKIPNRMKSAIIPLSIYGTPDLLGTGRWMKRYPVYLTFLPIIPAEDVASKKTTDIAEVCYQEINTEFIRQRELWKEAYGDKAEKA